MRVVAIDPGTNAMGFYTPGLAQTFYAPPKAGRPERLAAIMDALEYRLDRAGPFDFVVYEEQFVRGGPATKALYGVVGIIEALAVKHGAGVMSVPQSHIRKFLGEKPAKGETWKDVMARFALARGFQFGSEHEADAFTLYTYVMENQ